MSLRVPKFLLCTRPASINWTPDGPETKPASRLCLALPPADAGEMAQLLRSKGYTVEEVPGRTLEAVSL